MICFLISRTDIPETGELNPANGFLEELRKVFPQDCRGLYICSDPDSWDIMDYYASLTRESFRKEGFYFERFTTLDGRNTDDAEELVHQAGALVHQAGEFVHHAGEVVHHVGEHLHLTPEHKENRDEETSAEKQDHAETK